MLFEWALRANLPIIGCHTDDVINFPKALQSIAKVTAQYVEKEPVPTVLKQAAIFWTTNEDAITRKVHLDLVKEGKQLVVVNPPSNHLLIFDAGSMPTPPEMIEGMLKETYAPPERIKSLMEALRGLSQKTATEVVLITEARTGSLTASEVRKTRSMVTGTLQGLNLLDTSYEFYAWPDGLREYLDLNKPYFLNPTHPKLTPRGLMLAGQPGVGKSMAAKVIANEFDVPLYHLDIASVLGRYVGESEQRLARIFSMVDREEPAVLVIDEVEKVFGEKEDSSVTQRILSQMLWWLAEHQSRVFTIMTTNKVDAIPRELYRAGRVDKVMEIEALSDMDAIAFAWSVLQSVLPKFEFPEGTGEKVDGLVSGLFAKGPFSHDWAGKQVNMGRVSHAEVAEAVYTMIKQLGWK